MSDPFFENLPVELSTEINNMYQEMTDLKVHRDTLLDQYRLNFTKEELLEQIMSGDLEPHPAYDNYLAVLAINGEIEIIREKCRKIMEES